MTAKAPLNPAPFTIRSAFETRLFDAGELGNGPEDAYTAPEDFRRVFGAFTLEGWTERDGTVVRSHAVRFVAMIPPSWTTRDVERHFRELFPTLRVSRDSRIWRGL